MVRPPLAPVCKGGGCVRHDYVLLQSHVLGDIQGIRQRGDMLPEPESTLNLFVATRKVTLASRVPEMVTAPFARLTRSISAAIPILASVKQLTRHQRIQRYS